MRVQPLGWEDPGGGRGSPLQYSCLGNPMDGGAWQASVHGVAKSRTRLSDFTFTFHFHALEREMATHSCSCLENPGDGGAWWAAVYGVAQSWTRLKRLSSSSSPESIFLFMFLNTWNQLVLGHILFFRKLFKAFKHSIKKKVLNVILNYFKFQSQSKHFFW